MKWVKQDKLTDLLKEREIPIEEFMKLSKDLVDQNKFISEVRFAVIHDELSQVALYDKNCPITGTKGCDPSAHYKNQKNVVQALKKGLSNYTVKDDWDFREWLDQYIVNVTLPKSKKNVHVAVISPSVLKYDSYKEYLQ